MAHVLARGVAVSPSREPGGDSRKQAGTLGELDRAAEGHGGTHQMLHVCVCGEHKTTASNSVQQDSRLSSLTL